VIGSLKKHQAKKGWLKIADSKQMQDMIHFPLDSASLTQIRPVLLTHKKRTYQETLSCLAHYRMNLGCLHKIYKTGNEYTIGDPSYNIIIKNRIFKNDESSLFRVVHSENGIEKGKPFIMKVSLLNDDTLYRFNVTTHSGVKYKCTSYDDMMSQAIFLSQNQSEHYYGHFSVYDGELKQYYTALFMPEFTNNLQRLLSRFIQQSCPIEIHGSYVEYHALLAQTYLCALLPHQLNNHLCHNDLKLDNVMYEDIDESYVFVILGQDLDISIVFANDKESFHKKYGKSVVGDCYMIPTFGKKIVLIDFGISHYSVSDVTRQKRIYITSDTAASFMRKGLKAYDENHDIAMLICSVYDKITRTSSETKEVEFRQNVKQNWTTFIKDVSEIYPYSQTLLKQISKWDLDLYIKTSQHCYETKMREKFLNLWCSRYLQNDNETQDGRVEQIDVTDTN
jgi:hypothetical protein